MFQREGQVLLNVVMLENHGNMPVTYVKLKGLEPEAVYQDTAGGRCYTGSALMEAGLPLPVEMGEYLAYLSLVLLGLFSLSLPAAFLLKREQIVIPEWEGMGAFPFWGFLRMLFPVALMFAALQFFLFEAARGMVNGILLQFLCGVGMGYLAGYFYPAAFFPERMRMIGAILPSGAAARYVEEGLFGRVSAGAATAVLAYLAVFFILTVILRKGRIGRE